MQKLHLVQPIHLSLSLSGNGVWCGVVQSSPSYPSGRQYIVLVGRRVSRPNPISKGLYPYSLFQVVITLNPSPLPLFRGAVSGVHVGQADTCRGRESSPRRYGAYTLYAVRCVRGVEGSPRILSPVGGAVFRFFRRCLQTVLGGVTT